MASATQDTHVTVGTIKTETDLVGDIGCRMFMWSPRRELTHHLVRSTAPFPWFKRQSVRWLHSNPYRSYNADRSTIFIHIPKNAGSSVKSSLFGVDDENHKELIQYEAFDAEKCRRFFTFCIVRNPWDRMLSAFTFLQSGGLHATDEAWANRYLDDLNSFKAFVHRLKDEAFSNAVLRQTHFAPQYVWVTDSRNSIGVDYVVRFEHLHEDLREMEALTGWDCALDTHENKSSSPEYEDVYDTEMRKRVARFYQRDIELFDYTFGES